MKFIDTHAHIDMDAFDNDREEIITMAKQKGLAAIVQIIMGPDTKKIDCALDLVKQYPNFLYAALGLHPHDADQFEQSHIDLFENYFQKNPSILLALGEIGLDYYYENSPKEDQQNCFNAMCELANKVAKPVCIHTRNALEDTLSILNNHSLAEKNGTIIHCFSENKAAAKRFLDMGAYLSFSGIVTFKKSQDIQEAAQYAPLNKILIETDCPYLAPTPHRGKRNEPKFVFHTLEFIAKLKNIPTEELAKHTFENSQRIFNKKF